MLAFVFICHPKTKLTKAVQVEQRFEAPQQSYAPPPPPPPQQNYADNNAPQAQNNFDYTKFFDFGFFSNAAATLGGAPHPAASQGGQVYSYQKQISPHTVLLHKTVIPSHVAHQSVAEVFVTQDSL